MPNKLLCVCSCVYVLLSVCVYMCVCICICLYMHVCCTVYMIVCMCMCLYISMCMYVCILMCVCMCCIYVCISLSLSVAGRSSEVERSCMVRWVVGSILHGVDPLSYFSFQPVLHDWCNKNRGMCYPVCGMVHIKEPLLLIDKSSLCGGSGFPFSLSEWSLTICLTPYNRR